MATYNTYVFDCPAHGVETAVLCWRAFEQKNRHLWQKHRVTSTPVDMSEDELEEMLAALRLSIEKGLKNG